MSPREIRELTPSQREVFGLMILGLSNLEISTRLYGRPDQAKRVKFHVTNILKHFSVPTRLKLVVKYYQTRYQLPGGSNDFFNW